MRRALLSVAKVTQAGNVVHLSEVDPHILNVKTGQKTKLRKERNCFMLDQWIRVPEKSKLNEGDSRPTSVAILA